MTAIFTRTPVRSLFAAIAYLDVVRAATAASTTPSRICRPTPAVHIASRHGLALESCGATSPRTDPGRLEDDLRPVGVARGIGDLAPGKSIAQRFGGTGPAYVNCTAWHAWWGLL